MPALLDANEDPDKWVTLWPASDQPFDGQEETDKNEEGLYPRWSGRKYYVKIKVEIDNAPSSISRAKYSASRERSIGIGAPGFHAYLQKNQLHYLQRQNCQLEEKL